MLISETQILWIAVPVSSDNFQFWPGKKKEKLGRAISAERILLFLDHILYHRAHFVHDAQSMSRAVLATRVYKVHEKFR